MNFWSHHFSQNMKKKCQDFWPTHYRAEIPTIFCSYFRRNDDFINSFKNLLTFRYAKNETTSCQDNSYPSIMWTFFLVVFVFLLWKKTLDMYMAYFLPEMNWIGHAVVRSKIYYFKVMDICSMYGKGVLGGILRWIIAEITIYYYAV